jgi:hypothetical protein
MDAEEWRVIADWQNYAVSSMGRVKRLTTRNSGVAGAILAQFLIAGYPSVNLSGGGRRKSVRVHRLVAEAFIPNEDSGTEVNHIDAGRTNNLVANLEWVSASGNRLHAYTYGKLRAEGESNGYSKLTEIAVREIRQGGVEAVLAARFSVSVRTIRDVRARRTWQHVL